MGKDNLLIGTARGKLGDVVFYRTGGEQRFRTRVRPMNPRTYAQLVQRCVVSTVVKAYSNFVTVCDHAFQNYTGKMKNQQRYMKLNIDAFRKDALTQINSWSPIEWKKTGLIGNWAYKDDTSTYVNPYILSEGDLPEVNIVKFGTAGGSMQQPVLPITFQTGGPTSITYDDVANQLGVRVGDQLTFIMQTADQGSGKVQTTRIARIILMPSHGDTSEPFLGGNENNYTVASPNVENNGQIEFGTDGSNLTFSFSTANGTRANIAAAAVIVSRYENNMWRRSNSIMKVNALYNNRSLLQLAVASFLKSQTSSEYLNQATTGDIDALEARSAEIAETLEAEEQRVIEEMERAEEDVAEQQEKSKRGKK